jgi:hypothetical protein
MAEGHGRDEWGRMSIVCCLIANANRDPKKSGPVKPDDFNPYAERRKRADAIEVTQENVGLMRAAFIGSPESQKGFSK